MTRFILVALALGVLAGAASAHPFIYKITANGTALNGARAGISADAVSAVVLSTGTTAAVR